MISDKDAKEAPLFCAEANRGRGVIHEKEIQNLFKCFNHGSGVGALGLGQQPSTGLNLINALNGSPAGFVWAQFGISDPGNGTYERPFNSLALATNGVASAGAIVIKGPGSTRETMRIAKPMKILVTGGPATIGS